MRSSRSGRLLCRLTGHSWDWNGSCRGCDAIDGPLLAATLSPGRKRVLTALTLCIDARRLPTAAAISEHTSPRLDSHETFSILRLLINDGYARRLDISPPVFGLTAHGAACAAALPADHERRDSRHARWPGSARKR
jgi:hypothetical protein